MFILLINGVGMSLRLNKAPILIYGLMSVLLSSCYHPPYNNFKPDNRTSQRVAQGAIVGTVAGTIVGASLPGAAVGAAVGGTVGAINGAYRNTKPALVKELQKQDIQFVQYGDSMTLIVPVDKYFMFMSPRLNELGYPGLVNVIKLLKLYPNCMVYVAAFTDNVGSRRHKRKITQAHAETMLSYLWANGIKSKRLNAAGYGDKNDIADNKLIHGSAQNRRIEIQWFNSCMAKTKPQMYIK